MKAGETNAKGHLLVSVLLAQIDAIQCGLSGDELIAAVIKGVKDSEDEVLLVLEEAAARPGGQAEPSGDLSQRLPLDLSSGPGMEIPLDSLNDWDFMMSDAQYSVGDAEPN